MALIKRDRKYNYIELPGGSRFSGAIWLMTIPSTSYKTAWMYLEYEDAMKRFNEFKYNDSIVKSLNQKKDILVCHNCLNGMYGGVFGEDPDICFKRKIYVDSTTISYLEEDKSIVQIFIDNNEFEGLWKEI